MQELEKKITYKAFKYKQVVRDGNYAIYEYTDTKWESQKKYYDVIIIKIIPECTFPNGIKVPAHEAYPKDRSWGDLAWTYTTLDQAKNKLKELIKNKNV